MFRHCLLCKLLYVEYAEYFVHIFYKSDEFDPDIAKEFRESKGKQCNYNCYLKFTVITEWAIGKDALLGDAPTRKLNMKSQYYYTHVKKFMH